MRNRYLCPICNRFFATVRKNLARSFIKDFAHHLVLAHKQPAESALGTAEAAFKTALEVKSSDAVPLPSQAHPENPQPPLPSPSTAKRG